MLNKKIPVFVLVAMTAPLTGCDRTVSYKSDIQPVFDAYCAECHTPGSEGFDTSGFNVSNYETVMKGTRLGPVVEAGSAISSTLYLVIAQKAAIEIQMPPSRKHSLAEGRGKELPDNKVDSIQRWIDQGAKNN